MPPLSEAWDKLLGQLEQELPALAVASWLRPLVISSDHDRIRLVCPSPFHRDHVRARYLPRIVQRLRADLGRPIELALELASEPAAAPPPGKSAGEEGAVLESRPQPRMRSSTAGLRQSPYTFESFVVGPGNALAREAAVAIARKDQFGLRQLYLASETGLGKTHLSRAVVAEARQRGARHAVYTSAEAFTNEFLGAIRSKETSRFKQRFRRDCELLVVEDVRFLEGKKATQLEFFHTLRHVLDAGGRVVLTGDRLPMELSGLDEQVRAQLACGLVAQIEGPDATVRRSILRSKAAGGGVKLPDACLELLVDAVRGSVRDLESVLIQLVTTATLLKKPIDLELTREALAKKYPSPAAFELHPDLHPELRLDPARVIHVVASFFKTSSDALASRSRRKSILVPRQLAMYLCHRYTDASLSEIAKAFRREHPSVKNAILRIERQVLERAPLRYQVEALSARIDEQLRTPS